MLKKIPAIILLFVFLSLQFGKLASYLYCKWQAEVMQGKPDCGCEDHLVAMFDHHNESSKDGIAKNNLTETLNEFMPRPLIELCQLINNSENSFTSYNTDLSERFLDTPFHPPIS